MAAPVLGERECEYELKWHFDADDYDVLIGHYTHTHVTDIVTGERSCSTSFPNGRT